MSLLVIGSLNMDYISYMDRLPLPGETVCANEFIRLSGGKGANQAVAAARSGEEVTMIGCTGKDEIGSIMITGLKESGVNTEYINIIEGTLSGMAFINVSKGGENSIVIIPGANAKVTSDILNKNIDILKKADAVLLQHEIPLETVNYALKLAKKYNKLTILNPAPAYPISETLNLIDILVVNEHELSIVSGMETETKSQMDDAAAFLIAKGVKRIILTLGEKGLIDYYNNEAFVHEAYLVKAVDTTAAGDTFIGAFCSVLLKGAERKECIDYAQKAAALAVTKKGAQASIPTKAEIESYFA